MSQLNKDYPGWSSLPEHVKKDFEETFANSPTVIQINRNINIAQRARQYVLELQLRQKLDEMRLNAQKNLLTRQEDVLERVTLLDMGLTHEQLDKINILIIALYMACDMLELFAVDINSELKKVDKTARFEMFDPILKVGKEARENLKYLWNNTSMYDTEDFNNQSDNMREMLVNKAKKVYVKYAKVVSDKEAGKQKSNK